MNILLSVNHPAQVHVLKNIYWKLTEKGHNCLVLAVEKELVAYLLTKYKMKHHILGKNQNGLLKKILELIITTFKTYKISSSFNPDLFFGVGYYAAYVANLLDKPVLSQGDSEPALKKIGKWFFLPFSKCILVPECYSYDFGSKMVKYNGYKELAYLHPNNFIADKSIYNFLSLNEDEPYFLLRFVAWGAAHDMGQFGLNNKSKLKIIKLLEEHGRVFISSESKLPTYFEKYQIHIPPEKIHDALFYSKLFIGDSQTMTTEAGILGVPAIRCNSWVGKTDMANFIELEKKYELIFSFRNPKNVEKKILELLSIPNLRENWNIKRKKLLEDKSDSSKLMTDFILNYPQSFETYRSNKKVVL